MARNILVVEDDRNISDLIRMYLEKEGFEVRSAYDGGKAIEEYDKQAPDMVLLDIMLPVVDGWGVCAHIREKGKTPIIMLTAKSDVGDRITGLEMGADDYLVKPFDLTELSARIRALLRRQGGRSSPVLEHGQLLLNPATHEVMLGGAPVNLSVREFALLHAFLEQPGVPLSRAQLEERLYGWDEEIESNVVEVYIHSLRRKLGAEWIRNVRGVGYLIPERA